MPSDNEFTRILQWPGYRVYHKGFVYQHARFGADKKSIEVTIRPRQGASAICSGCHEPTPGYDHLPERRFEFIPFWGFLVFFLYCRRRVNCGACGVVAEELPWGDGKHQSTKAHMLFLARWARKLSWKETAEAFHTSWDKVCGAVEYVVEWGLQNRTLESIQAIGVDEIQYAKGHKYLTLVYQIDQGLTRLLWVGQERTIESFRGFFTEIGDEVASQIQFVCSDMWQPYLDVIRAKCSNALHILDRFHIVAKMNKVLDEVRAAESRRMKQEGHPPLLSKSRCCVLKRKENLTSQQKLRLRDLVRYNLQTVRAYLLKEDFQQFWNYNSPRWAGMFLDFWCRQTIRSRIEPPGDSAWTYFSRASLPLLPRSRFSHTLKGMEVHFTPEQETQLAQIATKAGTAPESLVTNVVARYLDEEARFFAAVEKGIAAAERGEFIEEEEMDARLEAMFKA